MPAQRINQQQPLPDFHLPELYQTDKWKVKEWDLYKNSITRYQAYWNSRSNITSNVFDFTLCKNKYIREELKYFMYHIVEYKKVSLVTFSEYYDRYKILSEYINIYMINNITLLDLKDFSLFEFFLSTKKKNKLEIKNGTALIGGEIKKTNRKSRFVTFISYVQQILDDYYNADIPETERLIWRAEK